MSLNELIARREALERQIRDARMSARSDAIAAIRELIAQHGLTPIDLNARVPAKAEAKTGARVATKYLDQASGDSWTGRGLKPRWLTAQLAAGKSLEDFKI